MKKLSIAKCPKHGFWAVCVDGDGFGTRLTPSKCCGRWDTVKEWTLTEREWQEISEQAIIAAEEASQPTGREG